MTSVSGLNQNDLYDLAFYKQIKYGSEHIISTHTSTNVLFTKLYYTIKKGKHHYVSTFSLPYLTPYQILVAPYYLILQIYVLLLYKSCLLLKAKTCKTLCLWPLAQFMLLFHYKVYFLQHYYYLSPAVLLDHSHYRSHPQLYFGHTHYYYLFSYDNLK